MDQLLNIEYQQLVANSVCHAAEMVKESVRWTLAYYEAPSVLYRPKLSIDGDTWCALYGDNLQDGVAGFGKSPKDAMHDFDRAWSEQLGKEKA